MIKPNVFTSKSMYSIKLQSAVTLRIILPKILALQKHSNMDHVRDIDVDADPPRSPSVTVQPEPPAASKAQRHREECAPTSDGKRRKTVALIYGDKVNSRRRKSAQGQDNKEGENVWNHEMRLSADLTEHRSTVVQTFFFFLVF